MLRLKMEQRDDLVDFAEWALNSLPMAAYNAPLRKCKDFVGVQTGILYTKAPYQVEITIVQPGVYIPAHTHPHTDSIEYPISGAVRFTVNGHMPYEGLNDAEYLSAVTNNGLRIPATAVHTGKALDIGAMFMSFQRWNGVAPMHIGEDWHGITMGETHDGIVEAVRGKT